jgi:hypothetical protein
MSVDKKYPRLAAIQKLLWEEWDPIGMNRAGPDDEYDQYAMGVWSRVEKGADADEIEAYLWWAATVNMGLNEGDLAQAREHTRSIAQKALAIPA